MQRQRDEESYRGQGRETYAAGLPAVNHRAAASALSSGRLLKAIAALAPTHRGCSGVAANGVRLDGTTPDDAILGAYTIAPFDDCGGHVNLHVGYHYHAVTDCLSVAATTLEAADSDASAAIGGQIGISNGRLPDLSASTGRW